MALRIIIAGGGTGGHLFPGIALAEEFKKRNPQNEILFIGTEKGIEKRVLPKAGFPLRTLDVEGIKGKGLLKSLGAAFKVPRSMIQAAAIIDEIRPQLVIGVGGYASGPAVLMARLMGIKTAIAEQNALPGITNRILGRFAHRIFLTFAETQRYFARTKTRVLGNPIRKDIAEKVPAADKTKSSFTVFIFGGSQGAHAINMAVMAAFPFLGHLSEHLHIIHQTGSSDYEAVKKVFGKAKIKGEIFPFINDMATIYKSADLIICRSGATSLAEITASGKAAVLIPFPYAVGDHQTKNAETLVREGAAEMLPESELNGKALAEIITRFYEHPEALMEMEMESARLGNVRAAADIVDSCMEIIEK